MQIQWKFCAMVVHKHWWMGGGGGGGGGGDEGHVLNMPLSRKRGYDLIWFSIVNPPPPPPRPKVVKTIVSFSYQLVLAGSEDSKWGSPPQKKKKPESTPVHLKVNVSLNFLTRYMRNRKRLPCYLCDTMTSRNQGGSRIFIFGGAQKIVCVHAHHEHEARCPLRQGSRARLRSLEALSVFDALLCYIWALSLSILMQNGIKKPKVNQISRGGGGGGACAYCTPPPPCKSTIGNSCALWLVWGKKLPPGMCCLTTRGS